MDVVTYPEGAGGVVKLHEGAVAVEVGEVPQSVVRPFVAVTLDPQVYRVYLSHAAPSEELQSHEAVPDETPIEAVPEEWGPEVLPETVDTNVTREVPPVPFREGPFPKVLRSDDRRRGSQTQESHRIPEGLLSPSQGRGPSMCLTVSDPSRSLSLPSPVRPFPDGGWTPDPTLSSQCT